MDTSTQTSSRKNSNQSHLQELFNQEIPPYEEILDFLNDDTIQTNVKKTALLHQDPPTPKKSNRKKNSSLFQTKRKLKSILEVLCSASSTRSWKQIPTKVKNKIFVIGGKDFVMQQSHRHGRSALQLVMKQDSVCHTDFIKRLLKCGGKELVMMTDNSHGSVLHDVCKKGEGPTVIKLLLDVGGKDLVMMKKESEYNNTALHLACELTLTCELTLLKKDVIQLLLDVGGKDLATVIKSFGCSAIYSCKNVTILDLLLDVGGKDLIMKDDSLFQWACCEHDFDLIEKILKVCGKDIIIGNMYGFLSYFLKMNKLEAKNVHIFIASLKDILYGRDQNVNMEEFRKQKTIERD